PRRLQRAPFGWLTGMSVPSREIAGLIAAAVSLALLPGRRGSEVAGALPGLYEALGHPQRLRCGLRFSPDPIAPQNAGDAPANCSQPRGRRGVSFLVCIQCQRKRPEVGMQSTRLELEPVVAELLP